MARRLFFLVLIATWLAANLLWGDEWKFTDLGDLGGDEGFGKSSQALGISSDGLLVCGDSIAAAVLGITRGTEAFLWNQPGPMKGIGTLAEQPFFSSARAASREGRVIVGESRTAEGRRAFRWTAAEGMVSLGLLPRHDESLAFGVSGDGETIVGECRSREGTTAFRWSTGQRMVELSGLPGGRQRSTALAISDDGKVLVGQGESQQGPETCVWAAEGGPTGLGDLPGGRFESVAYAVSADGSVIVGRSYSDNGPEAFRWTPQHKMLGLGDLAGGPFQSVAFAVSADGQTIVGQATTTSGSEAFLWTPATGMQALGGLLQQKGLATGWLLREARGVSADGKRIVGIGQAPGNKQTAWLVDMR